MANILLDTAQLEAARTEAQRLKDKETEYLNALTRILNRLDNAFTGIDKASPAGWQVLEWDSAQKNSKKRLQQQIERAGNFANTANEVITQTSTVSKSIQSSCEQINLQVDSLRTAAAATATLSVSAIGSSGGGRAGGGRADSNSAALNSAFGLSTNSKKIDVEGWYESAKKWIQGVWDKWFGKKEESGGSSASSTSTPSSSQSGGSTVQQPVTDISGAGITTNKTYGKGDIWMISAWSGDRQRSIWPDGYSGNSGCAVASLAMSLSTLGIQVNPATIMSHNEASNPEYMTGGNWSGKYYGVSQVSYSMAGSDQEDLSQIDKALKLYMENPGEYSAPVISFNRGYSGTAPHFVVVYGKNADGTYKVADPSGNYIKSYKFVTENYSMDTKNKIFNANLTSVRQFKKK